MNEANNNTIDKSVHFKLSLLTIVVIIAIILFVNSFFGSLVAVSPIDNRSADERIAKISQVYKEGDIDIAKIAAAPKKSTTAKARTGKEVYNASCTTCHTTGVAGAPKYGNNADWSARVGQGLEGLLKVAINGKGAMPPRGTCGDCSDDELKAVVQYMLDAVK
jgi:cytochrome c5